MTPQLTLDKGSESIYIFLPFLFGILRYYAYLYSIIYGDNPRGGDLATM